MATADSWQKGLVQIYTGKGKGKTTASLGLAFRASGQGLRVLFIQFVKGRGTCGEHLAAEKSRLFEIIRLNTEDHFEQKEEAVKNAVAKTYKTALEKIKSGSFDLIILDEIFIALKCGYLSEEEVAKLIKEKPSGLELVLTGRYATENIISMADLVTEMSLIKHPKDKDIPARRGIEY